MKVSHGSFTSTAGAIIGAAIFAAPHTSLADGLGGFDAVLSAAKAYGEYTCSDGCDAAWNEDRLGASAAYTHESGFGGQLDYSYYRDSDSYQEDFWQVHLYYRTGGWALGLYQERGDVTYDGDSIPVDLIDTGVEGKLYFDRMTLYGEAGRYEENWSQGPEFGGRNVYLEADYYLTDNWLGGAALGYADYDYDEFGSTVRRDVSLVTEYRIDSSPLSLFASYEYSAYTYSDGEIGHDNTLVAGIKLNFGNDTLHARDRNGIR